MADRIRLADIEQAAAPDSDIAALCAVVRAAAEEKGPKSPALIVALRAFDMGPT